MTLQIHRKGEAARPGAGPLAKRKALEIEKIMKKYPIRRSAVMDLLFLVQEEDPEGRITPEATEEIGEICEMTPAEVAEMITFYTMYHREPVGTHVFWVCGTLPCALSGSDGLFEYMKEKLGVGLDEVTEDGLFTIKRMECLGACSEAPLVLAGKKMVTKLTRAKVDDLIDRLRGKKSIEDMT